MKKHRILLVALLGTILTLLIPTAHPVSASADAPAVNCDPNAGPCPGLISGTLIQLEIDPKPVRAMKTLTFRLTVPGLPDASMPSITLGMPGMNMGPNSVPLKRLSNGVFTGNGVIVRCPSGTRKWNATVSVPNLGKTEFVFHVIY